MKKLILICIVLWGAYIYFADTKPASDPVAYVTAETSTERVAEDIIRDVFGAQIRRAGETTPMPSVESIKSINQADGTAALDMRVHLYGTTEHGLLINLLGNSKKLFPRLAADERLKGYNEFRLYGSTLMRDRNGNESEDWVSKVFFTRRAIEDIAWDKTDTTDLHFLLTKKNDGTNCTYWIHGGILAKISWLNTK